MIVGNIVLLILVGLVVWKMTSSIQAVKNRPDKIRLVSRETGQVVEMHLVAQPKSAPGQWNEADFVNQARVLFNRIAHAVAAGKLKDIRPLVTPPVYQAFAAAASGYARQNRHIDFKLISFNSVKVKEKKENEVRVAFTTEQINLLKDAAGQVLEGDPMTVAVVSDIWTFKKTKNNHWVVCATQSGGPHA
ncbi:MAG: Tim44-like domain-containing protein [Alphaproteobacteria bacterium]|nr:Tim44-like domain-containing protein [Alphaproteobacteria bacterium]